MANLDGILSENLDSILKPDNKFENQVKKIHQETANKYCLWHRNGEPLIGTTLDSWENVEIA